ncbi:MAG: hypothetical protein K6G54_07365 [Oscillospiraceae bacterium]|nr:hypothetical protein [Oscillospiraceae bacterium]
MAVVWELFCILAGIIALHRMRYQDDHRGVGYFTALFAAIGSVVGMVAALFITAELKELVLGFTDSTSMLLLLIVLICYLLIRVMLIMEESEHKDVMNLATHIALVKQVHKLIVYALGVCAFIGVLEMTDPARTRAGKGAGVLGLGISAILIVCYLYARACDAESSAEYRAYLESLTPDAATLERLRDHFHIPQLRSSTGMPWQEVVHQRWINEHINHYLARQPYWDPLDPTPMHVPGKENEWEQDYIQTNEPDRYDSGNGDKEDVFGQKWWYED